MRDTLTGHLTVATCIGCGARSRGGECPDGCADVALDLVDIVDLADAAERAEALEARVAALRELALAVAGDAPFAWAEVHERAREAIRLPVPPEPDIAVIEAWGCPRCGRIDAPQPCLGVCVRRPGAVADASGYRRFAERSEQLAADDRALTGLALWVREAATRRVTCGCSSSSRRAADCGPTTTGAAGPAVCS